MVNYRKIFWSKTPSSWKSIKLGSILKRKNKKFGNENKKTDPVVFSVSNKEGFVKSEDYFDKEVPSEDLNDYKIIEKGQFAYNPARINVGSIAFLSNNEWGLVSPMYEVFSVDRNETTADFIKYFFFSDKAISLYKAFSQGSVRQVLKFNLMKDIPYSIPPLPEQKKIAEVLSTLDDAIQKTEEIIERTKKLKKGLMQDLLTKGIGHEKFKEVQLGPKELSIPSSWELEEVGKLCSKVVDGPHSTPEYVEEGVPFVSTNNLEDGELSFEKCKYISRQTDENLRPKINPERGDVLFTKVGTLGLTDLIETDRRFNIFVQLALLKPIQHLILPRFLEKALQLKEVQDQITAFAAGSTMDYIGTGTIKKLELPLPPLPEQKRIAKILSTVDKKIQQEQDYKEKLGKLKKGLMQDLLTGKVRVLSLLSNEETEEIKEANVPG